MLAEDRGPMLREKRTPSSRAKLDLLITSPTINAPLQETRQRLRRHHDLDAAVLLVPEGFVEPRTVLKFVEVRNDVVRIDLPPLDPVQQIQRIAVDLGLPGADREPLVHRCAEGNLV